MIDSVFITEITVYSLSYNEAWFGNRGPWRRDSDKPNMIKAIWKAYWLADANETL